MTDNDKVPELTPQKFEDFIKGDIALIDFFAEWCTPCLTMAPILDELSNKFKDKIKFGKVNIKGNEELAQKFKITSIPNLILFKEGKLIEQVVGSKSFEELEEKLKEFIK